MDDILKAALKYAEMGLAVIPVNPKNKHPYKGTNGSKDASTDPEIIKQWWFKHPFADVAIVTGQASGLVVIDEDYDEEKGKDGIHEVHKWESENGELPPTWTALTGRGGYHLYYRIKDNDLLKNRAGILDGVDVRGEGGYVIAPPSLHPNGKRYEWEYAPEDCELAEADEIVRKFLSIEGGSDGDGGESSEAGTEVYSVPDKVKEGKRNTELFRMASSMWAKNHSKEAIIAAVLTENNLKCDPPLKESEVRYIIDEMTKRYKQGVPKGKDNIVTDANGWREPEMQKDDNGKVLQTIANCAEAIEYDKELFGKIKYNILAYAPFIFGELPWEKVRTYREWKNSDDSNLKSYIEKKYGLKSMERISEGLTVVTSRNVYNPVIDFLEECKRTWDGQKHIENLLPDYLGVEKNDYSIEVMKLFMLGAISRAYHPGCKFDYMIVIYGEQGVGKSTFFKRLAVQKEWYSDNFNTVDGDKAFEKLRGMWIVEMAELLAAKKTQEVESIKAFITSTDDNYRPPYGRRTEQRPRFCVFAGTTNNEHFLTDQTGNRRFLPITSVRKNIKKSIFDEENAVIDMRQAWGEAMHIFEEVGRKPKLILPKKAEEIAKQMQTRFLEEDPRVGLIQEWLDSCTFERVCATMIYRYALGNTDKTPSKRETNEIHSLMRTSIKGWQPYSKSKDGKARVDGFGVCRCFERVPEEGQSDETNPFL